MNPLTNMKNIKKLSEQELTFNSKSSWHDQYIDSAWIFVGGLPYDLTEGDVICIFSQFGEIVNINLVRDKDTGKAKGFCFICYEDQRSTVLAVDNFNGIKIVGRIIRVDHVSEYKVPKEGKKTDEETKRLYREGCAPHAKAATIVKTENPVPFKIEKKDDMRETLADQISGEIKLPPRLPIYPIKQEKIEKDEEEKSSKKNKRKKKSKKRSRSSSSETDSDVSDKPMTKPKKSKSFKSKYKSDSSESDRSEEVKRKYENEKSHKRSRRSRSYDRNRKHESDRDKSNKYKKSYDYKNKK